MVTGRGYCQKKWVTFGDRDNDIEMLNYVGAKVAMGNANPALKKISNFVTASYNDNGIVIALKHLFSENKF